MFNRGFSASDDSRDDDTDKASSDHDSDQSDCGNGDDDSAGDGDGSSVDEGGNVDDGGRGGGHNDSGSDSIVRLMMMMISALLGPRFPLPYLGFWDQMWNAYGII